jgi:hypothetical protein
MVECVECLPFVLLVVRIAMLMLINNNNLAMSLKRPTHRSLPRPPTSFLFRCGSGMGKTNLINNYNNTNLIFRKEYYADIFDSITPINTVERDINSSQPFLREFQMEDIVSETVNDGGAMAGNREAVVDGRLGKTRACAAWSKAFQWLAGAGGLQDSFVGR